MNQGAIDAAKDDFIVKQAVDAAKEMLEEHGYHIVDPHKPRPEEETMEPWDWLENCVSLDGEGYCFLQSPAGGAMTVTNEARLRIVAAVKACRGVPPEELNRGLGNFVQAKLEFNQRIITPKVAKAIRILRKARV